MDRVNDLLNGCDRFLIEKGEIFISETVQIQLLFQESYHNLRWIQSRFWMKFMNSYLRTSKIVRSQDVPSTFLKLFSSLINFYRNVCTRYDFIKRCRSQKISAKALFFFDFGRAYSRLIFGSRIQKSNCPWILFLPQNAMLYQALFFLIQFAFSNHSTSKFPLSLLS